MKYLTSRKCLEKTAFSPDTPRCLRPPMVVPKLNGCPLAAPLLGGKAWLAEVAPTPTSVVTFETE